MRVTCFHRYNPIKTLKTSFLGTMNMLGLAKRTRARFLLTSTSEVGRDFCDLCTVASLPVNFERECLYGSTLLVGHVWLPIAWVPSSFGTFDVACFKVLRAGLILSSIFKNSSVMASSSQEEHLYRVVIN